MSILLQCSNEDLGKAGLMQQDNCTFTPHQRHVNCVGSQREHRRAAKFSMRLAHMSSITHMHYEVTDWARFTQLWASPWSHNSTNCNIYRIWLMLKYLYATSLILSFPSSLHPPLREPASPAASLQNGKCEHHRTQKEYYNTQVQKKTFLLCRSFSAPLPPLFVR